MSDVIRPERAILSVSDKTGLIELGRALAAAGVELISTGGTAKALADAGLTVKEVGAFTGFPEMMDGRVKTLHPVIHGGLLARRDKPDHLDSMRKHAIAPIDVVVVNLYPFEATVARGADFETCVENIDIGGPSLIRGAAKNHDFVAVLTDPAQYADFIAQLGADGGTSLALRRSLAAQAYARTGAYDAAISQWFAAQVGDDQPSRVAFGGSLLQGLRYGENPHQSAAFYSDGSGRPGVATAKQLQGKELSYNNINDTDAAYELAAEFDKPACAVIKHANPCGVALGRDAADAWTKALAADPLSAFGGVVAFNRPIDAATATMLVDLFLEVVIAPSVQDDALPILATKKNLRVLAAGGLPDPNRGGPTLRSVAGGLLVQNRDVGHVTAEQLKTVTQRAPTAQELADLLFAFTVCKHVKSNAIVLARDGATVGVGGGQTSRVDAAKQAVARAAEFALAAGEATSRAVGAVVASDAFFPFPDGLMACVEAGVTAAIQPGGAMRDKDVIEAADGAGAAMVMTGMRHFRH